MNDFYNQIFKKISNTNFTTFSGNSASSQLRIVQNQQLQKATDKAPIAATSSKTTRLSGKISRLSKAPGSGTGSVGS